MVSTSIGGGALSVPAPDGAKPASGLDSFRDLGRSTALLTLAGLVGQAFAIVRTLFVAAQVGASSALDALLVAQVLPVVVSGLIATSLRTALVPAYVEIIDERGSEPARRFVGAVITWVAIIGALAVAALVALPEQAIRISGPGLDPSATALGVHFLPIVAPILVFSAVATLLGALCQAVGRFLPIAIGLVVAPLVSLASTILLWGRMGLDGLALGLTLGWLATLVVTMAYVAGIGLLPPFELRADRRQVRRFLAHALPLTAGSAVLQLNLLADRAVASFLGPGAVSALNYGQQIVLQPLGSLSSAWTTVIYPWLVRTATRSSATGLGAGAMTALRYTLVIFVPIGVATAALAPLVVDVFYRRGAFDAAAAAATSSVVAAFAPVLVLTMIQPILTGTHNARRRGALLGFAAVINAILNAVLDVALGFTIGIAGVGLSTSITVGIVLAFLAWRVDEPGFSVRPLAAVAGRSLIASLVPGGLLALLVWGWLPPLTFIASVAILVGATLVGLATYLLVAHLLGLTEAATVARTILGRRRATGPAA